MLDKNILSKVVINDITDHLPVLCYLPKMGYLQKDKSAVLFKRKIYEKAITLLRNEIATVDWNNVYKTDDVNEAYGTFYSTFLNIFDKCCPMSKVSVSKRNHKPWFTKGLINACHKKKCFIQGATR